MPTVSNHSPERTWCATHIAVAIATLMANSVSTAVFAQTEPASTVIAAASISNVREAPVQGVVTLAQFDTDIMRQRGLDPLIGDYFRRAPRFAPGDNIVNVTLNGTALGRKSVTFNKVGLLCFTAAFVRSIGLKAIADVDGNPINESSSGTCLSYIEFAPRTVVTLQPTMSAIDIVTPPEFVMPLKAVITEQGGTAAVLNYRAYALESRFNGVPGTSFRQLDTTIGFNADDWIFRSQQTYSDQRSAAGNSSRLRWQSTYGQKTFADERHVLQVGRSFTQSPLYGGIAFTGAQWFPERALIRQGNVPVTGVANSRARVEVTQNGALLYSTVVPPGPFSVSDFPLTNRSTDLQVRIIEENGAQQNFVVPASTLLLAADNTVAEGLSVSGGQLWDVSDTASLKRAPLLTLAQGLNYGGRITGVAGGAMSSNYVSGGVGLNAKLWDVGQAIYLQALAAKDSEHNLSGVQGSAAVAFSPSADLQFGFSGNLRSRGYRSLQEVKSIGLALGDPTGSNTQLGGNVRWNSGRVGAFTAGLTRQTYFKGDPSYIYSLGWNVSVLSAQLSVGLAHNTARNLTIADNSGAVQQASSYLYVNLVVPLGHAATSTSYARRSNESGRDVTRLGTGVDQRVNEYFGYRATVEKVAGQSDSATTSLSAFVLPKYTSVSLGAGQGQNSSNQYIEASGGVIVHPEGVAFTPGAVQDTFGVVKVGDVSGVKLQTPQGPVWSGINGLAGVPSLLPYYESRIEVSGMSLPVDVDLDNGLQVVQAGRGSVLKLDMGATRVRRVLLLVTTPDGAVLPPGSAVLRDATEYFTASASGGRVMLTDMKDDRKYSVQLRDGKQCEFRNIQIQAKTAGEQFERGTATCE